MKAKFTIESSWRVSDAEQIMRATHFAINYFSLETGSVHVKMLNCKGTTATTEKLKGRKFIVVIPRGIKEYEEAILHEMCHVNQFYTGRLKFRNGQWTFGGKLYFKPRSHVEYLQLPWEMEARAMEEVLLDEFWAE